MTLKFAKNPILKVQPYITHYPRRAELIFNSDKGQI